VQEVLYAAYASAGLGRKIALPFRPRGIARPVDLWKHPELAQAALEQAALEQAALEQAALEQAALDAVR